MLAVHSENVAGVVSGFPECWGVPFKGRITRHVAGPLERVDASGRPTPGGSG